MMKGWDEMKFKKISAIILAGVLSFNLFVMTIEASSYNDLRFNVITSRDEGSGTDDDFYFTYVKRGTAKTMNSKSLDHWDIDNFEPGGISRFELFDEGISNDIFVWDMSTFGATFKGTDAWRGWLELYYPAFEENEFRHYVSQAVGNSFYIEMSDGITNQILMTDLFGYDFSGTRYETPYYGRDYQNIESNWTGIVQTQYGFLQTYSDKFGTFESNGGMIYDIYGTDDAGNTYKFIKKEDDLEKYINVIKDGNYNTGYSIPMHKYHDLIDDMLDKGINKVTIEVDPNIGHVGEAMTKARESGTLTEAEQVKSSVNLTEKALKNTNYYDNKYEIILTHFTFVDEVANGKQPAKSKSNTYFGGNGGNSKVTYGDGSVRHYYNAESDYIMVYVPIANPEVEGYANWNNYDVDELGPNIKINSASISVPDTFGTVRNIYSNNIEYYDAYNELAIKFDLQDTNIKNINEQGFTLNLNNISAKLNGQDYKFAVDNGSNGYKEQSHYQVKFDALIIDTAGIDFDIEVQNADKYTNEIVYNIDSTDNERGVDEIERVEKSSGNFFYATLLDKDGNSLKSDSASRVTLSDNQLSTREPFKLYNNKISTGYEQYSESATKLKITMFDRALNKTEEIVPIKLDTLAPRVNLTTSTSFSNGNKQKRLDFNFEIEDINDAKLYYCFVSSGTVPAFYDYNAEEPPTSGEINTKAPTWYYLDTTNENVGTTASITLEQDEKASGTLYYFAVDSVGNSTIDQKGQYFKQAYDTNFKVAEMNLIVGEYENYPKDYDIEIVVDKGADASYYWSGEIDHDDDPTTPLVKVDTTVRTNLKNVGDSSQTYKNEDGDTVSITLDGLWTLNYQSISAEGNPLNLSESFTFDNNEPTTTVTNISNAIGKSALFSITAIDATKIKDISYSVVSATNETVLKPEVTVENINDTLYAFDVSIGDLETGAYRLKVTTEDTNLNKGSYYHEFKIRNTEPTMSITSELTEYKGSLFTKDQMQVLEVEISEQAENAKEFADYQFVEYRTRITDANGKTITSDWKVHGKEVDGTITPTELSYKGNTVSTTVSVPTLLTNEHNKVTVDIRFVDGVKSGDVIYSVDDFALYLDSQKPEFNLRLEPPRDSKSIEAMTGELLVSDDLTDAPDIMIDNPFNQLIMTPILGVDGLETGTYAQTFTDTVKGNINIFDIALNEEIIPIEVDGVDTTPPFISVDWENGLINGEVDADDNNNSGLTMQYVQITDFLLQSLKVQLFKANGTEIEDYTPYLLLSSKGEPTSDSEYNRFGEYTYTMMYDLALTNLAGDHYVLMTVEDAASNVNTIKINFNGLTEPEELSYTVNKPTDTVYGLAPVEIVFNNSVELIKNDDGTIEEALNGETSVFIAEFMEGNYYNGSLSHTFYADRLIDSYTFYAHDGFGNITKVVVDTSDITYDILMAQTKMTTTHVSSGKTYDGFEVIIPEADFEEYARYNLEIEYIPNPFTRSAEVMFIDSLDYTYYVNSDDTSNAYLYLGQEKEYSVYYKVKVGDKESIGEYRLLVDGDTTPPELSVRNSDNVLSEDVSIIVEAYDDSATTNLNSLSGTAEEIEAQYNALTPLEKSGISKIEIEHENVTIFTINTEDLDENATDYSYYFQTFDDGTGNLVFDYKVTENGSYKIIVTNGSGLESSAYITIDNYTPSLELAKISADDISVTYKDGLGNLIDETSYYGEVRAEITINDVTNPKGIEIYNNNGSNVVSLYDFANEFTFVLKDINHNFLDVPVSFDRFDTEKPVISELIPSSTEILGGFSIGAFYMAYNVTDNGGIAKTEIYIDGTKVSENTHEGVKEFEGIIYADVGGTPRNGIYKVVVTDIAGNKSERSILIDNFDLTNPVAGVMVNTKLPTRNDVILDVYYTEENVTLHSVEFFETDGKTVQSQNDFSVDENRITVKENGILRLKYYDMVENFGITNVSVNNIWKESPEVDAKLTLADDLFSVNVAFEKIADASDHFDLSDYSVIFRGEERRANESFTLTENDEYWFEIVDPLLNYKEVSVTVTGIDKTAPVVTKLDYQYDYAFYGGTEGSKIWHQTIMVEDGGLGYSAGTDENPVTNQNVLVTITTDKPTSFVGGTGESSTENSVIFSESGAQLYTLEKDNTLVTDYEVAIHVIDKTPPEINNLPDLIIYENPNANSEPYNKSMIVSGFEAIDRFGTDEILTDRVEITYDTVYYGDEAYPFNPETEGFFENNDFDSKKPYYVTYTVYDKAGNKTEIRRKITLVGLNDAIVLVNGMFPDSAGSVVLPHDTKEVTLEVKNSGTKAYARYVKNYDLTMGQMKIEGMVIAPTDDKTFKVSDLEAGNWNTFYLQTENADYFNIDVLIEEPKQQTITE